MDKLITKDCPASATIVVDNNEGWDVADIAAKHHARYVQLRRNYGLSVGRNIGTRVARGQVVIFLDDDAVPGPGFVAAHVAEHSRLDIVGLRGKCLPKTNSVFNHLAEHYDLGDAVFPYFTNLEGNSSFRREFLMAVGGFNPGLAGAGGHEGAEITCRSIARWGNREQFVYSPLPVIYHDYADSYLKYLRKQLRHRQHEKTLLAVFPEMRSLGAQYPAPAPVRARLTPLEHNKLRAIVFGTRALVKLNGILSALRRGR